MQVVSSLQGHGIAQKECIDIGSLCKWSQACKAMALLSKNVLTQVLYTCGLKDARPWHCSVEIY